MSDLYFNFNCRVSCPDSLSIILYIRSEGKAYEDMSKDELDDLEDEIDEDDEKVFEMYRWVWVLYTVIWKCIM